MSDLEEHYAERIDELESKADALTAENERLRARVKELFEVHVHAQRAAAAEARLATAVGLLYRCIPGMPDMPRAAEIMAFLASAQPAAPTTLDQDLAAAHPHLFPAAPTRTPHGITEPTGTAGGNWPAAPTRTDAALNVCMAPAHLSRCFGESCAWCKAELARRGLK